jgi:hypothetical protein
MKGLQVTGLFFFFLLEVFLIFFLLEIHNVYAFYSDPMQRAFINTVVVAQASVFMMMMLPRVLK